ncbi:hypothetical protein PsorP6_003058 [Peronosclerospora sorghi]|uniref:Uncharacterized protein n=1 Tax=Peronosclerospora sorghi TaxID=230839 RepID=A0ACC0VJM4_9STRA|nr:hypothetical protein PsorP6_003058 [Peronosclerospora sorghi]
MDTLRPTPSMRFSLFLFCDEDAARAAPVLKVGKYRHAWSFQCQVEKGDELSSAIENLMAKHVYPNEIEKRGKHPLDTRMARIARRYPLQFSLLKENPVTVWKDKLQTVVYKILIGGCRFKLQSVNDYFDVAMLDEGKRMLHFMAALPDSAHSPLYIRSGRDNESDRSRYTMEHCRHL